MAEDREILKIIQSFLPDVEFITSFYKRKARKRGRQREREEGKQRKEGRERGGREREIKRGEVK